MDFKQALQEFIDQLKYENHQTWLSWKNASVDENITQLRKMQTEIRIVGKIIERLEELLDEGNCK